MIIPGLFSSYLPLIEEKIDKLVNGFDCVNILKEACGFSLVNGKRFRPAIALMVAKALKSGVDIIDAAISIELFHTASLIIDDLPCMDDEEERRCKPALHIKYGEATALLAGLSLMSEGYACLQQNANLIKEKGGPLSLRAFEILSLVLENVTKNSGLKGATTGQYLDLFPPKISFEVVKEVIQKKTASLFEAAFVTGWLYGGGEAKSLSLVKKAAQHFGVAFQINDDFKDAAQDLLKEHQMNLVAIVGQEKARELFDFEIESYFDCLQELNLDNSELRTIGELLKNDCTR